MRNDYKKLAQGHNCYRLVEMDRDGNSETIEFSFANPCQNCYSVAKAFTVIAVGMLYDKGLLKPETKLCDVLGKYLPKDHDEKWDRVTLDHVLTHRIGWGSGLLDIDIENPNEWPSKDYLQLCFDTPLVHEPGDVAQYTDAAFYIASRIVSEVTGQTLCDYMRPLLMDTMNFKELAWSTCPQGYSMGATGLYLRTEDMVKLGVLMLRRGDWFGTRVVSEEWIDLLLTRGYEFHGIDHGLKWYGKPGHLGQLLAFNIKDGYATALHSSGSNIPVAHICTGLTELYID